MKLSLVQFAAAVGCTQMTAATWFPHFVTGMAEFQIDRSSARVAGFLAQISHESGNLARVEESLNYSVQGLANTWGRFSMTGYRGGPPNELAMALGRIDGKQRCDQERLANVVYGGRLGNGAPESGDGWRYRGRGPKQITGRRNYSRCGIALNLPLLERPALLLEERYGARAAAWYWADAGCNQRMDEGDFAAVTAAINGGLIGHEDGNSFGCDDRVERLERAQRALA